MAKKFLTSVTVLTSKDEPGDAGSPRHPSERRVGHRRGHSPAVLVPDAAVVQAPVASHAEQQGEGDGDEEGPQQEDEGGGDPLALRPVEVGGPVHEETHEDAEDVGRHPGVERVVEVGLPAGSTAKSIFSVHRTFDYTYHRS